MDLEVLVRPKHIGPKPPVVSVVIPTYQRPRALAACLEALAGLDCARERYEVIVVDDGGPTGLQAVVAPFVDSMALTLARQSNTGPAQARNAGAQLARGRLLAFTDDDCRPTPDWLCALEQHFHKQPRHLIGGRTLNLLSENLCATTSQLIIEAAYAHYNQDPEHARFFASNNLAAPAALFRKLGGFDRCFRVASEDRELCDRWRYRGLELSYAPEAVVFHAHPLSFRDFCRQHFRYGRGAQRYHRVRALRGSGRLFREIPGHARFLGRLRDPLARLPLPGALPVVGMLAVWQLANAAGFVYESLHGPHGNGPWHSPDLSDDAATVPSAGGQ